MSKEVVAKLSTFDSNEVHKIVDELKKRKLIPENASDDHKIVIEHGEVKWYI